MKIARPGRRRRGTLLRTRRRRQRHLPRTGRDRPARRRLSRHRRCRGRSVPMSFGRCWLRRGSDAIGADGVPRRARVAHAAVRELAGQARQTRVLVLLHARAAVCADGVESARDAHGGNPVPVQQPAAAARLSRRKLVRARFGVVNGARTRRPRFVVLGELRANRRSERWRAGRRSPTRAPPPTTVGEIKEEPDPQRSRSTDKLSARILSGLAK
jgi:hypothetical protein